MQAKAKTVQDASQPASERAMAVGAMAGDAIGSRMLMGMAINEAVSDPVKQAVQDSILNSPDRTVRVLARNYLQDAEEESTYAGQRIAQMETDRQNGQRVFYAHCAVCHKA